MSDIDAIRARLDAVNNPPPCFACGASGADPFPSQDFDNHAIADVAALLAEVSRPHCTAPSLAEITAACEATANGDPVTTYWIARIGVGGIPTTVRFYLRDGVPWAECDSCPHGPAADVIASLYATGWWRWDDITHGARL